MALIPSQFYSSLKKVVDKVDIDYQIYAKRDLDLLLKHGVDSVSELEKIIGNKEVNVEIRAVGCWFMSRLESKQAYAILIRCLNEDNSSLRAEIARALGTLGDKRAFSELCILMKNDEDEDVRFAAVYAIGLLDTDEKILPLIEKLEEQTEISKIRGLVAETLGNSLDKRAIIPLLDALKDESLEVRFWSIFALGEIGAEEAISELEKIIQEDKSVLPGWWSLREEAEDALQLIKKRLS